MNYGSRQRQLLNRGAVAHTVEAEIRTAPIHRRRTARHGLDPATVGHSRVALMAAIGDANVGPRFKAEPKAATTSEMRDMDQPKCIRLLGGGVRQHPASFISTSRV